MSIFAQETSTTLNFKDAPLDSILNHLSKEEGFIVIYEDKLDEPISVSSGKPVNKDETITLLNAALENKGFVVVRNGRTIKIVTRTNAKMENLPVKTGNDPSSIPKNSDMVTQIIPVYHIEAKELITNLTPFLKNHAIINSNEDSNAIILTDTQANINRIVQIIRALDQSEYQATGITVFPLDHSDPENTTNIINDIFKQPLNLTDDPENPQQQIDVLAVSANQAHSVVVKAPRDIIPEIENLIDKIDISSYGFSFIHVFKLQYADAEEMASVITDIFKKENSNTRVDVVAVGDTRTNAVAVKAPFDTILEIEKLISKIDISSYGFSFINIFTLKYADAGETAEVIKSVFQESDNFGDFYNEEGRRIKQNEITVSFDERTNSVVVCASRGTMKQISDLIETLDANPARNKQIYVYSINNLNGEQINAILQALFDTTN